METTTSITFFEILSILTCFVLVFHNVNNDGRLSTNFGHFLRRLASETQILWIIGWIAEAKTNFFEILGQFPF